MLSKDQARALLANRLSDAVVILDERTIEKDWGWVFFYQSKRFVETKNRLHALVGNGPRIVNRFDGSIHFTGTKYPVERYIQRYERQLTGEAPDFGENPGEWLNYVTFDTSRYYYEGEPPGGPEDFKRKWRRTRDCRRVELELLLTILPPKLPAGAGSFAQIEQFCRTRLRLLRRIMEFRLVTLDEIDCIWTLSTRPPESPTDCYFGEITIPFADFTFELSMFTAVHSAVDGSEAVSRLRREFAWISRSLRVHDRVKDQTRFELPRHG